MQLIQPVYLISLQDGMSREAGQEIHGWLDRAPCILRDGRFSGLLRMRNFPQCHQSLTLILRSAQRARLEGRITVMQPFIQFLPSF